MNKKIPIVVGITILFLGTCIAPSITANIDKISTESSGKTVEIIVSRYKADSTVEKINVILSKEKALEFKERYRVTVDSDKRFSLLKEYGLIPEDVTREQLRQEMLSLADELGFSEDKIESISERFGNNGNRLRLFGINLINEIWGHSFATLNLPIGLFLIASFYFDIPFVGLLYIASYFFGEYQFYNGILPDFYSAMGFGFFCLLGFIGYVVSLPFLALAPYMYDGFTVASLAIPVKMGLLP